MKLSRYFLVIAVFSIISLKSNGQAMYSETLSGIPLKIKVYENVTGSPYLFEDWKKGYVVFQNGSKSIDLDLKFDQVSNDLIFRDKDGKELTFANRVLGFTLYLNNDKSKVITFRRGYPKSSETTADDFFQVLFDKDVKLLIRNRKIIIDSKQYASANVERSIEERKGYYFFKNNEISKISNFKSFEKLFPPNADDIRKLVKDSNLNFKNEDDLIKLVEYLKTLK